MTLRAGLLGGLALCSLVLQAQTEPPFEQDIRKFEAEDAANPPKSGGIVFVGSSSIRLWTTLSQDFPGRNVINRGFGGSQVSDSVRYIDRIVTPYKPKMVVFYAGTNDIWEGKSPETVVADYKSFVQKVHAKLPKTVFAYISISPAPSRWSKIGEIRKANGLIETFTKTDKRLLFVNTFPLMLDAAGNPRPELFVEDQLHMNPSGYKIWVKEVGKILPKD